METMKYQKLKPKIQVFKSYYVVWKQIQVSRVKKKICLFKSYYVVWKPCVGMTPTLASMFV